MPLTLVECPACGRTKWTRSPRPKCNAVECPRRYGNMKAVDPQPDKPDWG